MSFVCRSRGHIYMHFRRKNNMLILSLAAQLFVSRFIHFFKMVNSWKQAQRSQKHKYKKHRADLIWSSDFIYTDASYSELGLQYTQMLLIPVQTFVTLTFRNWTRWPVTVFLASRRLFLKHFTSIFPVHNLPYVLQIIGFHVFVLHHGNIEIVNILVIEKIKRAGTKDYIAV